MFIRALLLAAIAVIPFAAAAAGDFRIVSDRELTGPLSSSRDVRWEGANSILLAAAKDGVFRLDLDGDEEPRLEIAGEGDPDGFFFSVRLGVSRSYLVTGAHFASLSWRPQGEKSLRPSVDFDLIADLDVYGDQLLVYGARRDRKGRWAPDGAIVWLGTLSKNLSDLRPVHYSEAGPGAEPFNRCHFFSNGAVRFLRDGSFVVVPGVEPDVYHYSGKGKLLKTWQSSRLAFHDRCDLSEAEIGQYALQPSARRSWINQRSIVEEVIPFPEAPALFLRKHEDGKTTWLLRHLERDGGFTSEQLPITAGPAAHARADWGGGRLAILIYDFETLVRRLVILERER